MGTQGKMLLKGEEAEKIEKRPWDETLKQYWNEKTDKGQEWF